MSSKKKQTRKLFRDQVFLRSKYHCEICTVKGYDRQELPKLPGLKPLDAHHINNRTLFENGGYVKENGISVCDDCHLKCEEYWETGIITQDFMPDDLYKIINSSEEAAFLADSKNH